MFNLEKMRLRVDSCTYLKRDSRMWDSVFSHLTSDRTWGHVFKLYQRKFKLDIRKNFFSEKVVRHWNKMSRDMVESPSLEIFKN